MKAQKQFLLSVAAVFVALATINCGSSGGGSSSSPAAPAAYGTSCGTNMLNSQYGCLPQCAANSVTYNGQCVPISGTGTTGYGYSPTTGFTPNTGNVQMCQGICPPGLVQVQGGYACLQQNTCGACYGYYAGNCYIGDYAHQYYGY